MGLSYVSEVLLDHPAGYWRMNNPSGNIVDVSGNGNNGDTVNGTPVYQQRGALVADSTCAAILFNGTNASFSAPPTASLDITAQVTVEAWINRHVMNVEHRIVDKGGDGSLGQYEMRIDSTNKIHVSKSTVADIAQGTLDVSAGVWHHVVWTHDGVTADCLYLDSVDCTPGSYTHVALTSSGSQLEFATDINQIGNWFDGLMAEIAVYPTVLPPYRVLAHYQAGVTGLPSDTPIGSLGVGGGTW